MTPFWRDDRVSVINGDCVDVLPRIERADVVVTDPPYNVGIRYGQADDLRGDYAEWCRRWLAECRRIAPIVALTPGMTNLGMWYALGDDPDWVIAWHKPAAMGRCHVGFNNWEPVLLWGKPARQIADVVVAPLVPDRAVDGHPCPKPLKWATALIGALSDPGQTVLDPFMGSGTTLKAARDMGRRYIGIELEERFCSIAVSRLAQGVLDVAA